MKKEKTIRPQTMGEEIANAISHGVGAVLAIAGTVIAIIFACIYGDTMAIVSASLYGASLIILYLASTLYHSLTNKTAKKDIIRTGEEYVKKFLAENGNLTIRQLSEKTGTSPAAIHRMVRSLVEQGQIEKNGAGRTVTYTVKE